MIKTIDDSRGSRDSRHSLMKLGFRALPHHMHLDTNLVQNLADKPIRLLLFFLVLS